MEAEIEKKMKEQLPSLEESIPPEDATNCEEKKAPAVAVRFALGLSAGIHVKLSPPPKNLREAKNAAMRYCKTKG